MIVEWCFWWYSTKALHKLGLLVSTQHQHVCLHDWKDHAFKILIEIVVKCQVLKIAWESLLWKIGWTFCFSAFHSRWCLTDLGASSCVMWCLVKCEVPHRAGTLCFEHLLFLLQLLRVPNGGKDMQGPRRWSLQRHVKTQSEMLWKMFAKHWDKAVDVLKVLKQSRVFSTVCDGCQENSTNWWRLGVSDPRYIWYDAMTARHCPFSRCLSLPTEERTATKQKCKSSREKHFTITPEALLA